MNPHATPKEFTTPIVARKRMCLCGRIAVKRDKGYWACERCLSLESCGVGGGPIGVTCGKKGASGDLGDAPSGGFGLIDW